MTHGRASFGVNVVRRNVLSAFPSYRIICARSTLCLSIRLYSPAPFVLPRNQSAYTPADSPLLLTALYPPLAAVSNQHPLSTSRAATVSTGILNYDWDDHFPPVPLATVVIHPSHGGARG